MTKLTIVLLCLACLCIGGSIGFFTAAAMHMSKRADEQLDRMHRKEPDE